VAEALGGVEGQVLLSRAFETFLTLYLADVPGVERETRNLCVCIEHYSPRFGRISPYNRKQFMKKQKTVFAV
jgi:hypothetical protein